jgi:hypothetical protein
VQAIVEGIGKGESNEEIRRRIARPDLILDAELDALRKGKSDLEDFIKTGR